MSTGENHSSSRSSLAMKYGVTDFAFDADEGDDDEVEDDAADAQTFAFLPPYTALAVDSSALYDNLT
jgi:hypothetical protein